MVDMAILNSTGSDAGNQEEGILPGNEKAGPHQYILCDLEDGKLILHEKYFREIDFSRYTFIFLPNPKDNHSDHMAAYLYTVNEIKRRNIKNIKVFQYEVHTPLPDATCYLDISTVIEKKQELVACTVRK